MSQQVELSNCALDARDTEPLHGGASFGLGHRLYRTGWILAWTLLCAWTPRTLHFWRRFVIVLFGGKIARSAHIYASARIWYPPNLVMAEHSCLGPRVTCYNIATVTLHKYAIASQGAYLCTGSHDIADAHFQLIARPIAIGENGWIATEAFVGPGVTVGEGAVLGARGVTFKDLPPWTINVGNPAARIGARIMRPAGPSEPC
jgi:putative colanic acid biosynthesis acetyltransferase WcaF